MDLASNIKDEFLVCKVCFIRFSRDKMPKMLHCYHTFCEQCLVSALNSQKFGPGRAQRQDDSQKSTPSISCPLCRKITGLGDDGVHGLSNDFTLLGLMDMVNPLKRQDDSDEYDEECLGATAAVIKSQKPKPSSHVKARNLNYGTERCVECHKRFPESQLLCGHSICDVCLQWYLETSKDDDVCPACKNTDLPHESKSSKSYVPNGKSAKPNGEKRTPPIPAPRRLTKSVEKDPPHADARKSSAKAQTFDEPGVIKARIGRPPPYNPRFINAPESPNQEQPQTSSMVLERFEKPTPSSAPPRDGPLRPLSTGLESDDVSLCSVRSESAISPSQKNISPLRRTQSMRRCPPPPPRRKYGTLPRPSHVLTPPPTSHMARSSEDLMTPQTGVGLSAAEGERLFDTTASPTRNLAPVPPQRRIFSAQKSPFKCVKKFGSYSDVSMQTSCFRVPSRVALSERGDIAVTDTSNMTIQVFNKAGDYKSMFKVLGVQDASFISVDKLCVATHRGIQIFSTTGVAIHDLPIGQIVATAPFKFGFVAASSKSLLIYRQSLTLVKDISRWKMFTPTKKWSPIQKKKTQMEFQQIRDIAITSTKLIAVLDVGTNNIIVMDEEGSSVTMLDMTNLSCGNLKRPWAIAADRFGNFYVSDSDNNRVLKVTSGGVSVRSILSYRSKDQTDKRLFPHGMAVTETDLLIVSLSGNRNAEIRIYTTTQD